MENFESGFVCVCLFGIQGDTIQTFRPNTMDKCRSDLKVPLIQIWRRVLEMWLKSCDLWRPHLGLDLTPTCRDIHNSLRCTCGVWYQGVGGTPFESSGLQGETYMDRTCSDVSDQIWIFGFFEDDRFTSAVIGFQCCGWSVYVVIIHSEPGCSSSVFCV